MVGDEILFSLPAAEIKVTAEKQMFFVSYERDAHGGERTEVTESRLGQLLLSSVKTQNCARTAMSPNTVRSATRWPLRASIREGSYVLT
jgi:hypothetical protein